MASTHVQGKSTNVASRVTLILALLLTCPCWALPTLVQQNNGGPGTISSPTTLSFPGNVTAGNTIITLAFWSNTTATFTPSDGSNTYNQILHINNTGAGGVLFVDLYCAANVAGGATTVTFTPSGTLNNTRYWISEWSGLATSCSPADGTNSSNGASGTVTSGSVTVTQSNDLLIGLGLNNSATVTVGAGFTGLTAVSSVVPEYKVVSSSTALTYNGSAGDAWLCGAAAFKPSGGGATRGLFQQSGMNGVTTGGQFFANPITFTGIWAAIPAFFWRKRFAWNPLIRLAICPRSKLDGLVTAWLVRIELGAPQVRRLAYSQES